MSEQDVFPVGADEELTKQLRSNFTSATCVEALLRAVVDMADAVGVSVEWSITGVDEDKIVDRESLTKALGRLATSGGALLVGGKVNPINILDANSPLKILQKKIGEDK